MSSPCLDIRDCMMARSARTRRSPREGLEGRAFAERDIDKGGRDIISGYRLKVDVMRDHTRFADHLPAEMDTAAQLLCKTHLSEIGDRLDRGQANGPVDCSAGPPM